nr:uncharacterized protein LOC109170103 [Ipomoea trifida]
MEMNYTMASNSRWKGGVDFGDFTGDRVLSFSTTLKILRRIKASGIFASTSEDDMLESENANATPSNKIGLRMYQQVVASMSQISYVDPKMARRLRGWRLVVPIDGRTDSKGDTVGRAYSAL